MLQSLLHYNPYTVCTTRVLGYCSVGIMTIIRPENREVVSYKSAATQIGITVRQPEPPRTIHGSVEMSCGAIDEILSCNIFIPFAVVTEIGRPRSRSCRAPPAACLQG